MDLKIAIIKWIDSSYFDCVNKDLDDKKNIEPRVLFSSGFLVCEEDNFVSICQDFEYENEMKRLVMSIPKVSIQQIEYININIEE